MFTESLKALFTRDLTKLKQELDLYKNEENIWRVDGDIPNSAGNLCLHLVGNLNTYFGAILEDSGYVRDRPAEFALKNIPREELVSMTDQTIQVIVSALDKLTDEQLNEEYPAETPLGNITTGYFLLHLATHLAYHLGQVNYHRRLLDV